MTNYKLAAASTATADSIATLDIIDDGVIETIQFTYDVAASAAAHGRIELSIASSSGFATNDTRSSFATFGYDSSGTSGKGMSLILPNLAINVKRGERLHMHHIKDGGTITAGYFTAHMHCRDRAASQRRTRL